MLSTLPSFKQNALGIIGDYKLVQSDCIDYHPFPGKKTKRGHLQMYQIITYIRYSVYKIEQPGL